MGRWRVLTGLLLVAWMTGGCGSAGRPADWRKLDPDVEKVLVLADFESDDEIVNAETGADLRKVKPVPGRPYARWTGRGDTRWQANRLEIADQHVVHGRHALKVHANVNSGHAWTPTLEDSFPPDWSDYDAIRFNVHWPEEKKVQWAIFVWLRYTDAEGRDARIQPWLLFDMEQGSHMIEIPLSAFDDLAWKGPEDAFGGGINKTAMNLWDQNKKYEYIHRVGWKFDRVYKMAAGLRGKYDPKVTHHYWMDYVRLVKKKAEQP
jgi:hypothetical protein